MNQDDKLSALILRVRFAETDKMGIAHHSSYVLWLEAARIEWLRKRGMSYVDWEEAGISLSVNYLNVNYRKPAYFDDELNIETKLAQARPRRLCFAYNVIRMKDKAFLATGETIHTPTSPDGKAIRVPKDWLVQLVGNKTNGRNS